MKQLFFFFFMTLTSAFASLSSYSSEEIDIGLEIIPPSQLVIPGEDICDDRRLHEEYEKQFEKAILKHRREQQEAMRSQTSVSYEPIQPLVQTVPTPKIKRPRLTTKLPKNPRGATRKKRQRSLENSDASCSSSSSYNPHLHKKSIGKSSHSPRKCKKKRESNYYSGAKTYDMSNDHIDFLGGILRRAADRGKTLSIVNAYQSFKDRFGHMSRTTFDPWVRKAMYAFDLQGIIESSSMQKVTNEVKVCLYDWLGVDAKLTTPFIYGELTKLFPDKDFGTEKTIRKYVISMKFGLKWQEGWRISPGSPGRLEAPRS